MNDIVERVAITLWHGTDEPDVTWDCVHSRTKMYYREKARAAVAELRAALRTATDALVRHHQWHAAQTTPDAEFGFIPADEYADSDMYEETVAALALANPLLADGPVNSAALSQKDTSHDA